MNKYFIIGMLAAGIVFFAVLAFLLFRSSSSRLAAREQLLRHKGLGAILGAAALVWCVPQVQAVAWSWLAQYAWFVAGAALLLCVRFLDNMVARGVAGLLIMGAYSFLDMSFDCKLNIGLAGPLMAWVWGGIGIVIAAKPCYLRDFLRLGAQKPFWRYLAAALAIVTVILLICSVLLVVKVQG